MKDGKVWFDNYPRITTNSFIRQIIPIDYKSGLIMISYTDGNDVDVFYSNKRKRKLKSEKQISNMIHKELRILFPNDMIPRPIYFRTHLWKVGAHHWKPGVDSDKVYDKILNPRPSIYVIGESFSKKQAWVEGGLETVESMMDLL